MNLVKIIKAIELKQVFITDHADEEAEADNLKIDEIYYSVLRGEVIEDYADDKPYPSCLVYGLTVEYLYIANPKVSGHRELIIRSLIYPSPF